MSGEALARKRMSTLPLITNATPATMYRLITSPSNKADRTSATTGNITTAYPARARAVKARENMVQANLRLVISVARGYRTPGIALAGLIQEGNIGLMKAVERFDPARGFRFSTYATHWIRQSVSRAIGNQGQTIRLPTHIAEQRREVRRAQARLFDTLGRPPSLAETAQVCDLPIDKLAGLAMLNEPASLDAPVGPDADLTMADGVESSEPELAHGLQDQQSRSRIRKLVSSLDERSTRILTMRFGLGGAEPMTLQDVGRAMSLSREWVRRLEAEAIEKCRRLAFASHCNG